MNIFKNIQLHQSQGKKSKENKNKNITHYKLINQIYIKKTLKKIVNRLLFLALSSSTEDKIYKCVQND